MRSGGSRTIWFSGIGTRAEIGMTPVESRGTATITTAMIVCAVNAVAMGQRLRLRNAGEDSSRVSPNISLTSNRNFDTGEWSGCSALEKNKKGRR